MPWSGRPSRPWRSTDSRENAVPPPPPEGMTFRGVPAATQACVAAAIDILFRRHRTIGCNRLKFSVPIVAPVSSKPQQPITYSMQTY